MMSKPATHPAPSAGWRWDHSYSRLPDRLYARVHPTPVRSPSLAILNRDLANLLGLNASVLEHPDNADWFVGNVLPTGSDPIAQAYAGHQYGHLTILGDGRAILLGEHLTPHGDRVDIQLKGPGRTPFSRGGDGRAALGPMLREYIISEAMHALGIPTTRSLAVAATGELVFREEPLPGAVLTRVAASHIRVGTFEWAAARDDRESLEALANYTRHRHYPSLADVEHPHLAFLNAVVERQAELVSRWLLVGFVHGVMNTDNMALSGETIDYGPCAFMDAYDPGTVFSSIDHQGRYAYARQPRIAQWNLSRFAETLLPLLHPDESKALDLANASIDSFADRFKQHWLAGMRAKLGLFNQETEDHPLIEQLLDWMRKEKADFTNTFRQLSSGSSIPNETPVDPEFSAWHQRWQQRLSRQPQSLDHVFAQMQQHNPVVIPRNHQVEEALATATKHRDLALVHRLLKALSNPFNESPDNAEYRSPAPPSGSVYRTFCGT